MHKTIPIRITINIEIDIDDGEELEQGITPVAAGIYPLFQPAPDMPNYPEYVKLARLNGTRPLSVKDFQYWRNEYESRARAGIDIEDIAKILFMKEWKGQQPKPEEDNDSPRD